MDGTGSSAAEGYISAFNRVTRAWGGVCSNGFDLYDAHVVCKMLGFETSIEALIDTAADDLYGPAPSGSTFTLDNLDCSGHETSIYDCPVTGELTEYCGATEMAAVKCSKGKS